MKPSVFTKIINKELPAHLIYENDYAMAIMDIQPIQPGMVVVFSKVQIEDFYDLKEDDYHGFMEAVKKVSQKMRLVYPAKVRIAVQIEGLDVPHAHAKIFPIDSAAEFHARIDASAQPDHEQLEALVKKLRI